MYILYMFIITLLQQFQDSCILSYTKVQAIDMPDIKEMSPAEDPEPDLRAICS